MWLVYLHQLLPSSLPSFVCLLLICNFNGFASIIIKNNEWLSIIDTLFQKSLLIALIINLTLLSSFIYRIVMTDNDDIIVSSITVKYSSWFITKY